MNYEEKYNEILAWARKNKARLNSEDERIRKEIIHYILYKANGVSEKQEHEWIAYLEKQKECVSNNFDDVWDEEDCEEIIAEGQKLTPRFKELLKEVCHAWYDRGAKLEKQKEQLTDESFDSLFDDYCDAHPDGLTLEECGKFFFSKGFSKGKLVATNDFSLALAERYCQGLRDGQEEHWKPTEKQDYSGLNDLERAIHRGFLSAGVENVPIAIIKETANECLAQMKPAEWSEKDEKMLQSIIKDFRAGKVSTIGQEQWLKFLPERFNLQPKQEWNTHDKAIVNCIVCCLDGQFVSEAARKQSLEWFNKHRRDFLNSTSWKPSEEQMKAFGKSINDTSKTI